MKLGFFLSCEEYGPAELIAQAGAAEQAGFQGLWISDHYHPWNHEQGESAFVWSVIGALAGAGVDLPVATAVTCPTVRVHPAVIAQAAATSQILLGGRFTLGVGTGEALNEHILGSGWPEVDIRLDMLEEAVQIMRALCSGDSVSHRGRHYTVENARIFSLPEAPPPIYMSGFGPKAIDLAARIGDGFVTTTPDEEAIRRFRRGGRKPVQAGAKVCCAESKAKAVKAALLIWPNDQLPGELAQVLPTPEHFEQAAELVTEEMVLGSGLPLGPDLDEHVEALRQYEPAGVDELYVQQIGGGHDAFFEAYAREVLPRFA
jgi:G6PDH family F420-dependent oxidoreductase